MRKYKKVITFFAVIMFSIFLSWIFEGIFRAKLPEHDDSFLYVIYIAKNLYVMFNIGVIIYSFLEIF